MKEYKYEQVKDMTVGQVVDAALNGTEFVEGKHNSGYYVHLALETIDVRFIQRLLGTERLLIAVEAPWWEKHVGKLVMVRDCDDNEWHPVYFKEYIKDSDYPFKVSGSYWKQMRPLTQAEKDAIITEG